MPGTEGVTQMSTGFADCCLRKQAQEGSGTCPGGLAGKPRRGHSH